MAPFLQVRVHVFNSAGVNVCCNYATDTLWQLCKLQRLLHLCRFSCGIFCYWYLNNMQVTVSVAVMQLEACALYIQVTVPAPNMWVTIFIVNYADRSLCCNYGGGIFYSALCT